MPGRRPAQLEVAVLARLRPAHGVALLFLANGLAHPSLWPRFPEIREALDASTSGFGLALLGMGLGGAIGSLAAAPVTRRLGPVRAATVSAVVLAGAAVAVGLAPTLPALFAAFAALGFLDGVADTSQNALLFEVQRRGEGSLASRMHAVWSAGALAGTATGTVAATVGRGVAEQMVVLAVVAVGLVAVALRPLRSIVVPPAGELARVPAAVPTGDGDVATAPGAASDGRHVATARARGRTGAWALLVVTGAVVAAVESTANEWSAMTLRDGLGASLTVAGLGPTVFAGAMLVGRALGDRAIDRFGAERTARASAGAVLVGGGGGLWLAAWAGSPSALVGGLLLAGIGTATLFPLMMAAGDRLDPTGRGVAAGSFGARVGFLLVPVVVGGLGDRYGLVTAFALLPALAVIAAVVLPRALRR